MTQPVRVGQVWRLASLDGTHERLVEVTQVNGTFVRIHGQRHSAMPVTSFLRRYEMVKDAPVEEALLDLDTRPLYAVREQVMEDRHAGTTCPACGQYAKVYRRKLTAATAAVLIRMYRMTTNDPLTYIYLPSLREVNKGGDVAKARYWNLIEAPPDVVRDDGSSRVGYWRLTDTGRGFVEMLCSVPMYAEVYNGELLGLDDSQYVTIRDVLGTRFDYRALMQGV